MPGNRAVLPLTVRQPTKMSEGVPGASFERKSCLPGAPDGSRSRPDPQSIAAISVACRGLSWGPIRDSWARTRPGTTGNHAPRVGIDAPKLFFRLGKSRFWGPLGPPLSGRVCAQDVGGSHPEVQLAGKTGDFAMQIEVKTLSGDMGSVRDTLDAWCALHVTTRTHGQETHPTLRNHDFPIFFAV